MDNYYYCGCLIIHCHCYYFLDEILCWRINTWPCFFFVPTSIKNSFTFSLRTSCFWMINNSNILQIILSFYCCRSSCLSSCISKEGWSYYHVTITLTVLGQIIIFSSTRIATTSQTMLLDFSNPFLLWFSVKKSYYFVCTHTCTCTHI